MQPGQTFNFAAFYGFGTVGLRASDAANRTGRLNNNLLPALVSQAVQRCS